MVRLTIRDSGKSIRAHDRDRIFEPYFESRPGLGNPGFGLALAYQFTALSGGSIEAEGDSTGTAYVLNFPALGPAELAQVRHE